jgi:hypothetical protein
MSLGKQNGQTLLIVVLVVIVALTVGLSLASRSITSLKTSTEEAESQKALAAAEAGIERAIQGSVPVSVSNPNVLGSDGKMNSSYSTAVTQVDGTSFRINGGNVIPKDEGADVWFVPHNPDDGKLNYNDDSSTNPGSVNLYWGLSGEDCSAANKPAAIQAIIVTRNKASGAIKSYRYVYDGDGCSRGNNFTSATAGTYPLVDNGETYDFKYITPAGSLTSGISSPKDIVLIRVIPIYKDTVVGLSSSIALPIQGYKIDSTGKSGQANRKFTVFKGWPQTYLPYLSYGLFVANSF